MEKKASGIRRFERVSVVAEGPSCREFAGHPGFGTEAEPPGPGNPNRAHR
ncbi:hypothetical protein ACN28I_32690 [Archangium gephyra]